MRTSYKGRVIGFILGLIFLRSILGALLFMFFGYLFFDRRASRKMNNDYEAANAFRNDANYNETLVKITFSFMGYVARGAGRINEEHIKNASQIMDVMSLNPVMRKIAIEAFNNGKSDSYNLDEDVRKIRQFTDRNFSFVNIILEIQVQLALSDGILSDEEYRRLMELALKLGASRESMEQYIRSRIMEMQFEQSFREQRYHQSSGSYEDYSEGSSEQNYYGGSDNAYSSSKLDAAYEILGVKADSTDDEIKKAHKRLMLKYHPDRLQSQGLTPEMIKLYTEKSKDIQAAFDLIKKERGFK